MTLDQLRYFQAVCKRGSVSGAAEILNISQPSVSSAIGKLEKEFDTTLFIRQNKKLTLTKEGTVLLDLANEILLKADKTVTTMKALSDNKALNLGVPPMLSSLILPILYSEFFTKYPDFKINFFEDDRSGLLRMLEENEINMAFLPHDKPFDSRFSSIPFMDLSNVCCVCKGHRLSQKDHVTIHDIKTEPLVLFKNSFFQTERLLERFKQKSLCPNILLDTTQVSTVQNMVSSGLAIGLIFEFLLKTTPELVGIPLEPPMRTQVSLVWKQGEHLSSNMNQLIRFIKNGPPDSCI